MKSLKTAMVILCRIWVIIAAIFALNFCLDALNAKDWFLFAIGVIGACLSVTVIIWIVMSFFRIEKKGEHEK